MTNFPANSTHLKTPHLTAQLSTSSSTIIPSTEYTMVSSSEEERARKQDKRAQQLHDLEIQKREQEKQAQIQKTEQEEQAQIQKTEQEEEFYQAKLATLKQPDLLEHPSTTKADEPDKSYNLPEGSGTLKLNLPSLAKKDFYNI